MPNTIVNIANITGEELSRLKVIDLNQKFEEKYPIGCFSFQIRKLREHDRKQYGLFWNRKRRTSHCSYKGLSITTIDGIKMKIEDYQNNSWGRMQHFNNLEDCIAYARKQNIPNEFYDTFIKEYKKITHNTTTPPTT